jgi:hypothetical protein
MPVAIRVVNAPGARISHVGVEDAVALHVENSPGFVLEDFHAQVTDHVGTFDRSDKAKITRTRVTRVKKNKHDANSQ